MSDLHPASPMLILVAGGPGAGKTSIGRALAAAIPDAVLLDKDVIASPWLDPVLARLNGGAIDRDSRVYRDELRPLEYASLMAAACDNLGAGKSAVVVAPFGPELRDREWIGATRSRASSFGARLVVLWISITAADARERIAARGDRRDQWKLANWDAFGAGDPYAIPHASPATDWLVLHNVRSQRFDGSDPIHDVVERALRWIQR